jgi:hypothetical protein
MNPTRTLIALQAAVLAFLLSAPAGAAPPLPRGAEIKVNTNTVAWHYDPSVAVFPDGGFVVVFTAGPREGEPGRRVIHARLFDSQGRPASGQFRLIDRVEGSQFVDQVVADRDGSFLVAWTENTRPSAPRRVFVRRFNRDGTPRGKRILVHGPSGLDRSNAVLGIAPDGRFAVAWEADVLEFGVESYTKVIGRIYSAQGEPLTGEFLVYSGSYGIGDDSIRPKPSGLALAPDGTLSVLVQSFETPDIVSTDLVRIPPVGDTNIFLISDIDCCVQPIVGASLVLSQDGGVMLTWAEEQIRAQRFTPEGLSENRFFVAPHSTEYQIEPVVTQHSGGSYVAVWVDADTWGYGLFGRVFNEAGSPLTGRFRVNKTITGDQQAAAIAASRQGPIIVVWEQIAPNGRADIYARLLK